MARVKSPFSWGSVPVKILNGLPVIATLAGCLVLAQSPAIADRSQPQVVERDGGKGIGTVVEDDRVIGGTTGRTSTGEDESGPAGSGRDDGPLVVSDPQCVATEPIDSWCNGATTEGPPSQADVAPFRLAIIATNQMLLPDPVPNVVPKLRFADRTVGGLVGAPMWLSISADSWPTITQRTAAGDAWAVVEARPTRQIWEFGNGESVTCVGRGDVYRAGEVWKKRLPNCGYRYKRTSSHNPSGYFKITVTVLWDVDWIGSGGTSGSLGPLPVNTSFPYVVKEARAQLVAP